nr:twin-arginine translocase TatA/TatE family subunit [Paracoccus aestuarii]
MLNNIGLPGLLLIAVVVLVLFGRGKISSLMGEVGKGITAFKRGVKDGSEEVESAADATRDTTHPVPPRQVPGETARDVTPHAAPPGSTVPGPQTRDHN